MTNKKERPVVCAGDIGWGYTKYSKRNKDGSLSFHSFPSLSPRAVAQDMSMNFLGGRDTRIVTVEQLDYEIGPDSEDLNGLERNLNNSYIYTDQYRAIFYGMLDYMGEETIDLLVLGLPVSGLSKSEGLKEMSIGIHEISKGKKIEVKDVLVLPQPLGGLYHCKTLSETDKRLKDLLTERNLIIDPGFLTLDFLTARGLSVMPDISGAYDGGVTKILRSIGNSISEKYSIKYDNLSAIDKALNQRKLKINGKEEDLTEHIRNTKSVIESSINYMKNIVGDGSDVDNIVVLGGGSEVFKRTIELFYKNHEIIYIDDPQMANVKGFYEAAFSYLINVKGYTEEELATDSTTESTDSAKKTKKEVKKDVKKEIKKESKNESESEDESENEKSEDDQ